MVKMKTPSVMKDSGIEWIGEIPKHWEIVKISNIFSTRNTKVSDEDYPALSVTKNGILPQLENVAKSDAHDNRKLVLKGDFAINSRSDRRGSCGMSDYDGSVSLIITVLKPENNIVTNYYHHLFRNPQFSDEFYRNGRGIVDDLWTTGWQNMKGIQIPYPPIEEQQLIAVQLNQICRTLDNTKADIEKQIEILNEYKKSVITETVTKGLDKNVELKDSEIDWIGEIPKHWSICKIKHISTLITDGAHISPDTSGDDYRFLSVTNMDDYGYLDFENCLMITEKQYRYLVRVGCKPKIDDVLISKDGTIGKVNVVSENIDFVVASSLVIIRPDLFKVDNKYLKYVLFSEVVQNQLYSLTAGSALKRVSVGKISNLKITIPPIEEQKEIADYLDSKCSEIDSIIETKKQQLELLEEYKKSIIYEYVTGKREVSTLLDEASAKPDFAVAQNTQSVSIESAGDSHNE